MAELASEIRSTFAPEENITMLNVNRLDCMAACFEEKMRMYPPSRPACPGGCQTVAQWCAGGGSLERWVQQGSDGGVGSNEALTCACVDVGLYHPFGRPTARASTSATQTPSCLSAGWAIRCLPSDQRGVMQPFHIGPRNCLGRKGTLAPT